MSSTSRHEHAFFGEVLEFGADVRAVRLLQHYALHGVGVPALLAGGGGEPGSGRARLMARSGSPSAANPRTRRTPSISTGWTS